jgi:hypothetical protein
LKNKRISDQDLLNKAHAIDSNLTQKAYARVNELKKLSMSGQKPNVQ